MKGKVERLEFFSTIKAFKSVNFQSRELKGGVLVAQRRSSNTTRQWQRSVLIEKMEKHFNLFSTHSKKSWMKRLDSGVEICASLLHRNAYCLGRSSKTCCRPASALRLEFQFSSHFFFFCESAGLSSRLKFEFVKEASVKVQEAQPKFHNLHDISWSCT